MPLPASTVIIEEHADGYMWTVPEQKPCVKIECWWNRTTKPFRGWALRAEHFILRQENPTKKPDVIVLDARQVYDLIHVLNEAVMKP